MENSGESTPISETAIKNFENRQSHLDNQLETLDINRPDHQVLGKFLSRLYEPQNYNLIDEYFSKNTNVRYQPKCALLNHMTNGSLGEIWGLYEYQPIALAVDKLDDHFNIFSDIQKVFSQSNGKNNQEIIIEVANIISEKTNISVFFEDPDDNSSLNKWKNTKDGDLYPSLIRSNSVGVSTKIYQGNPEIRSDIEEKGYSEKIDFAPKGDVIIINKGKINNPQTIQTLMHELGHIDEDRFVIPKILEKDTIGPNKNIINTEIISSLYGLKTCMLMAKSNPKLAYKMMESPVTIYNWVLTGTVAP